MNPNDDMMCGDADYLLLSRYLSRECTAEEAATVERWIAAAPGRRHEVDVLRAAWECAGTLPMAHLAPSAYERFAARAGITEQPNAVRPATDRARRRVVLTLHAPASPQRRRIAQVAAIAAAVVIAVASGIVWRAHRTPAVAMTSGIARELTTKAAQRASLRLADGTQITLGPASRLRVASDYGVRERTVELEGEARFSVVHDARRPFVVRTANAVAEDLGTTFFVTAHRDDATTDVAVIEGSVALRSLLDGAKRGVALARGQLGRAEPSGFISVSSGVDLEPYIARADGRLVFRKKPLSEVRRTLERWYDIRIDVSDTVLDRTRVSATFENKPAEEAVRSLARLLNVRLVQDGTVSRLVSDARER
jgi:ferric-dicitrate binding protein FerR (iron transport regulator)